MGGPRERGVFLSPPPGQPASRLALSRLTLAPLCAFDHLLLVGLSHVVLLPARSARLRGDARAWRAPSGAGGMRRTVRGRRRRARADTYRWRGPDDHRAHTGRHTHPRAAT